MLMGHDNNLFFNIGTESRDDNIYELFAGTIP